MTERSHAEHDPRNDRQTGRRMSRSAALVAARIRRASRLVRSRSARRIALAILGALVAFQPTVAVAAAAAAPSPAARARLERKAKLEAAKRALDPSPSLAERLSSGASSLARLLGAGEPGDRSRTPNPYNDPAVRAERLAEAERRAHDAFAPEVYGVDAVDSHGHTALELVGRNIAKDAVVTVDGFAARVAEWRGLSEIVVRPPFDVSSLPAGGHRITVTNPDGRTAYRSLRAGVPFLRASLRIGVDPLLAVFPTDTTPPAVAVTTPVDTFSTSESTVDVWGTVADTGADASGVARVLVNNVEATRDALAGTWTLAGVTLTSGANTIAVRAEDNAGNHTDTSITVTKTATPPADTTAPTISIAAPAAASQTGFATIAVSGTAGDSGTNATGVRHVNVNGHEATYNAGNFTWTVAGVALVEGDNLLVAEAVDGASPANHTTTEIHVTRRTVAAPTLTIASPASGATVGTQTVTVAGAASAGASDVAVSVTVNGAAAPVAGGQYAKSVDLAPLLDPSTHTATIVVVATDALGQTAQQSVTVVGDYGASSAPTVAFSSYPTSVVAGSSYTVTADASDNVGVASVEFAVNGQPSGTVTAAPYQFTLTIPANAAPAALTLTAVARDLVGNTAVATAESVIAGPGGVVGYAFDDATGFGLAGATVALGASSAATSADGAYALTSTTPAGLARLEKSGYTPVERSFGVATGGGTSLLDARLTPVDAHANTVGTAAATATGDGGRISVSFGAGSYASSTDVRVTSVSPQGLVNQLPFGWSPVPGAVVDVRPAAGGVATGAYPTPAQLTLTSVPGLVGGVPMAFARYDEAQHAWVVVSAGLVSGDGAVSPAYLARPGQYAFLVADYGTTAPPAAVAGQPLPAGPGGESVALDGATATATPSPATSVVSVASKSTISVVATSPTKLPSGLRVEVTFDESYEVLANGPVLADRPAQDVVVYAFPAATGAAPNRLGATFVAKPSRTDLLLGQTAYGAVRSASVHVVVRSGRDSVAGTLVGANGGTVTSGDGVTVEIPSGALGGDTSVFVRSLSTGSLGLSLPAGYEVVGAADVDLSEATLSSSATLTVPAVTGGAARVVVARVLTVAGRRFPKVVARAVEQASAFRSTASGVSGVAFPGIVSSGKYAFIRVPAAFGYATGTATLSSAPAARVLVTTDRTPFGDLTATNGTYLVVGLAGASTAGQNALDGASLDADATGEATASLGAQDAVATAEIALAPVPLAVSAVSPAAAATNVSVASTVTLTFSKPVLASSITGSTLQLLDGTSPVAGTTSALAGGRVVVFVPSSALRGGTVYTVRVTTGVRDLYGAPLAAELTSTFTTAVAAAVDDRLKSERVRVSYPDAQGMATVTIPAGAVPPGTVLIVLNNQTGATVTVTAGTVDVVVRILARVGDEIVVIVKPPDGTQYQVSQAAYRRADGYTTVGAAGGAVATDDGTLVLTVPAGAITGQASIKLSPRAESDMPYALDEPGLQYGVDVKYGSGLRIDTEGTFTVRRELLLTMPAPATAAPGDVAVFLTPSSVTVDGNAVDCWNVVTSGRVDGGRIRSNSPPFSGLDFLAPVTYIWAMMPVYARTVVGFVAEPRDENASCSPTNVTGAGCSPAPNVLCLLRGPQDTYLHRVAARTQADGLYSLVDFRAEQPTGLSVQAFDEATGRSVAADATGGTSIEETWLQGLQGFVMKRCDLVLPHRPPPGAAQPSLTIAVDAVDANVNASFHVLGIAPLEAAMRVTASVDPAIPAANMGGEVHVDGVAHPALAWTPVTASGNGTKYTQFTATFSTDVAGGYLVRATAATDPNDPATLVAQTVNFAAASTPPNGASQQNVPPHVLDPSVRPPTGSSSVDGDVEIQLSFSEPVKNLVAGTTVFLTDANNIVIGGRIRSGATIISSATTLATTIAFKPDRTLSSGETYSFVVANTVVDTDGWHLDQDYTPPTPPNPPAEDGSAKRFESTFTVFAGGPLSDTGLEDPSFRMAVAGDYAVTINPLQSTTELRVYDVSDPERAREVVPQGGQRFQVPQRATDVAMAVTGCFSDTPDGSVCSRFAVVCAYSPQSPEFAANLWIVKLDDVTHPSIIGVTSLYFPQEIGANPISVAIQDRRAYVGSTTAYGVIAVDLEAAISRFAEASANSTPGGAGDPARLAVTANLGFAWETKAQTVSYNSTTPLSASTAPNLAVLSQNVPPGGAVSGVMPVVYVPDVSAKRLVVAGFPSSFDGLHDPAIPYTTADVRLLNFDPAHPTNPVPQHNPSDIGASYVRAVAGASVAGGLTKDLALVASSARLWIYDVTDPRHPVQYPSKSYAEIGLSEPGARFDVEGTLAYVATGNRVAVIDFSDPANPRLVTFIAGLAGVGSLLSDVHVRDGFVFSLAPSRGAGDPQDGFRVSLAKPASQIWVRGQIAGSDLMCATPVIVSHDLTGTGEGAGHAMLQNAAITFKIFGLSAGDATPSVEITKITATGKTRVATLTATQEATPGARAVSGSTVWTKASAPLVDLTARYIAEVVVGSYRSQPETVVFAHLIDRYQESVAVAADGGQTSQTAKGVFDYLLAADAHVKLKRVATSAILLEGERPVGLNHDVAVLAGLPEGTHDVTLEATLHDDATVVDTVTFRVTVASKPAGLRQPGETVVSGVDIATGNLELSYSDVAIPCFGFPLALARSYNTANRNTFGPFGYGWRHTWQMLLVDDASTSTYRIEGEDGQIYTFPKLAGTAAGEMASNAPYHTALRRNADGSFDYVTKSNDRYHFSGAVRSASTEYLTSGYLGNLSSVIDPHGNTLLVRRDAHGRIDALVDPSGRELKFFYETAGTAVQGRTVDGGAAASITGCLERGQFERMRSCFAIGDASLWRVQRVEGPGGLRVLYTYDASNNLTSVTKDENGPGSLGSVVEHPTVQRFAYGSASAPSTADTRHLVATVTDPKEHGTTYEYDFMRHELPVTAIRYPESVSNTFEYARSADTVTAVTVTDGRSIETHYAFQGRFVRTMTRAGATTTTDFDDYGVLKLHIDAEGRQTVIEPDGKGNPSKVKVSGAGGAGVETSTTFSPKSSLPTTSTDANGNKTTYNVDDERREVRSIVAPEGYITHFGYYPNGLVNTVTDPAEHTTTYSYDQWGNLTGTTIGTGPEAVTSTAVYDIRGRMTSSSGTLEPSTTYTYTNVDLVNTVVQNDLTGAHDNVNSTISHDANGNVTAESTSGGGQSYSATYELDALDRMHTAHESPSDADPTEVTYDYDGNSNVWRSTDRRDVETTFTINDLNFVQLAETRKTGEATSTTAFVPDRVGNVTSVTDSSNRTTVIDYDGMYRPSTWHLPNGRSESVTYYSNGTVETATDQNGNRTKLSYDGLDRIRESIDPLGRTKKFGYDDASSTTTMVDATTDLMVTSQTDALGRPKTRVEVAPGINPRTTTWSYAGLTATATDPLDVPTTQSYTSFGEVASVTRSGLTTSMRYSALGALKEYTNPKGATTSYAIDGLNRTRGASMPEGATEGYGYYGDGLPQRTTDARGVVSLMTYDQLGRMKSHKVGDVFVARMAYDDVTHTVTSTDARDHATVSHYDELGRVVGVNRPDGTSVSYVYDGQFLSEEHDANGKITRYDYDPVGRVIKVTDPDHYATYISYQDLSGQTVRHTQDRNGHERIDTFNALGELVSTKMAGEVVAIVSYEYDGLGNRTAMVDGVGNRTTYEYDAKNRVHEVHHPEGRTEVYEYDDAGNVLSYDAGMGTSPVVMTYDDLNRLKTRNDPAGSLVTSDYDAGGLEIRRHERRNAYDGPAGGQVKERYTDFTYNDLRSLVKTTVFEHRPEAVVQVGEWVYGRDDNQNLASVTDALGHETHYDYDTMNRVSGVHRPLGREWTFGYDANGQQNLRIDPKNQRAEMTYDDLHRLKTATYKTTAGVVERAQTFGYDPESNLVAVDEVVGGVPQGRVDRRFDERNRLKFEDDGKGGTNTYTYDGANNLKTLTTKTADGVSRTLGYDYDGLNRLLHVTSGQSTLATYSWRHDDQLTSIGYANGMTRAYGYDAQHRLATITNSWTGGSEQYAFGYDVGSNRMSESRSVNGSVVRTLAYEYDMQDRLTKVTSNDGTTGARTTAYAYDAVGNRLTEAGTTPNGETIDRTYAYDDLNQLSTITDGVDATKSETFEYDPDGNLTRELKASGADRRYSYDTRDQMKRAWDVVSGSEQELGTYQYDYQKRRSQKTAASVTLGYHYNGNNVVTETSGNTRISSYDFGTDLIRADIGGEGVRWYGHDGLGSSTSLVGNDGALAARYEYGAWGEMISAAQTTLNTVGYTGYRKDDETGLDYSINRYYSPERGRFTSTDPLTELDKADRLQQPQGLNLYPYVKNNPLQYTDPDGLDWFEKPLVNGTARIQWFKGSKAPSPKWHHLNVPYTFTNVPTKQTIRLTGQDSPTAYEVLDEVPPPPSTASEYERRSGSQLRMAKRQAMLLQQDEVDRVRANGYTNGEFKAFAYFWYGVSRGAVKIVGGTVIHTAQAQFDPVGTAYRDAQGLLLFGEETLNTANDIRLNRMAGVDRYLNSFGSIENLEAGAGETALNGVLLVDAGVGLTKGVQFLRTGATAEGAEVGSITSEYGDGVGAQRYDPSKGPSLYDDEIGPTGGMESPPAYTGMRQPKLARPTTSQTLLGDELMMGRYDDIPQPPRDNLTPHHMPSAEYMLQRAGVSNGQGLAMNVEAPRVSGRHVRTETYGRSPFLDETPRSALARDIWDLRRIYRQDGLYGPRVRTALRDYIDLSRVTFPSLFEK